MQYISKLDRGSLDELINKDWPKHHKNRIIKSLRFIKRHNDLEYKYGSSSIFENWILRKTVKRLNAILVAYYDIVLI